MVADPVLLATLMAIGVGAVVALAEWFHARKTQRVAHLAFGKHGRPRAWTRVASAIRVIGAFATTWGLVALSIQQPEVVETRPTVEGSKHLLICLDASPSMYVVDAGPDGNEKRAVWAGELMQAILDRIDTETTRVTVFAVYTKGLPVIEDTFDLNVVRNLLDGLPLFAAFEEGPTRLTDGIAEALEYARRWEPESATLVVMSDGDADNKKPIRFVPSSIADTIVIGVGDPIRPTMVAGHRSKQDTASLRALASQLGGVFYQGNTKHLPSAMLNRLTMIRPRVTDAIGLRELAFVAVGIGGVFVSMIGPALSLLGRGSVHTRVVRVSSKRRNSSRQAASSAAPVS